MRRRQRATVSIWFNLFFLALTLPFFLCSSSLSSSVRPLRAAGAVGVPIAASVARFPRLPVPPTRSSALTDDDERAELVDGVPLEEYYVPFDGAARAALNAGGMSLESATSRNGIGSNVVARAFNWFKPEGN